MDVTSMLQYYNTIQKATDVSGTSKTAQNNAISADDMDSFTNLLQEEITELSDLKQSNSLSDVLDSSVLGGIPNLTELSMDMLKTSSGQKVLSELVNGQFASIVTSDSDQEEGKSLAESVLGDSKDDSEKLDSIIKKMENAIDTMKTSDGNNDKEQRTESREQRAENRLD